MKWAPAYCLVAVSKLQHKHGGVRKTKPNSLTELETEIRVPEAKAARNYGVEVLRRRKVHKKRSLEIHEGIPSFWLSPNLYVVNLPGQRKNHQRSVSWTSPPAHTMLASLCPHQPQQRDLILHGNWVESPESYQLNSVSKLASDNRCFGLATTKLH